LLISLNFIFYFSINNLCYCSFTLKSHSHTEKELELFDFDFDFLDYVDSQVHAGFAGFTGITVGLANNHYVLLPIPEVIAYPRNVDPNSRMWHRCLTSTGQPDFL